MQEATGPNSTPRPLFTVAQFEAKHPAFPQRAMRPHILNARDRVNSRGERIPGNGLAETGAILRIGRRVLIDEQAFFRWIAEQQKQRAAGSSQRHIGASGDRGAAPEQETQPKRRPRPMTDTERAATRKGGI